MRIRTVIVAVVLALAGGGAANALAAAPVDPGATAETRYGCAGVDPVAGICLNSPLETLDEPLDTVGGLLQ